MFFLTKTGMPVIQFLPMWHSHFRCALCLKVMKLCPGNNSGRLIFRRWVLQYLFITGTMILLPRNVTRNFEIWDVYKNSEADFFSAGATNIDPLTNVDYNANLVYTFKTDNTDSALFRITCTLLTDAFDPKGNDTLIYYQIFKNYFAFDDGSSEGGYGINGLGSRNAMVAYRFVSYMQDTLRAIQYMLQRQLSGCK